MSLHKVEDIPDFLTFIFYFNSFVKVHHPLYYYLFKSIIGKRPDFRFTLARVLLCLPRKRHPFDLAGNLSILVPLYYLIVLCK